ncbi:MAG: hypothetical protein J6O40_05820 [Ruminococcus sp.]|nr:hypothetical protein [Ruminococcus sp.]
MNDSIKKASNALFRAVIFCMLIVSVMMTYSMINMAVIIDDNGGRVNGEAIEMLLQFASLYQGVFYGSAACIVLSILSNSYKASSSAVFFRTLILGSMTGVMFRGLAAVKAISEIGDKFLKIDVSDYEDITEEMLKDAGMTEARAEELVETLQAESALTAILVSLFMCAAVYFLLSCTSLHNLLKKPQKAVDCGGCEDANELERLNPQMLNGGMHYNNVNSNSTMQAMPQFLQNINRSLGGGMENSKLINRYAAAMQQPTHDHHDNALAHDLAAEGEFHDYAQAEKDMTDDSSDYISQLQREENEHRVTDEDFM